MFSPTSRTFEAVISSLILNPSSSLLAAGLWPGRPDPLPPGLGPKKRGPDGLNGAAINKSS